jgi:hypothetical protein
MYGNLATVTTDSAGYYIFTDVPSGDYMVEPLDTTYDFAPAYYELTLESGNIDNINFFALQDTSSYSIDDLSDDLFSLECFPNPATGFVIVSISSLDPGEDLVIEIFTLQGESIFLKKVHYSGGELKSRIDLPATSKGIHFIAVSCRDQRITRKLIII